MKLKTHINNRPYTESVMG